MKAPAVEIIPAILHPTWEQIAADWERVRDAAAHIHIDITDGIFAGDAAWRDIRRLKQLPESEKIELHLMVHTPGNYVNDVVYLSPARCIFHLESFSGTGELRSVFEKLRGETQSELALAINPETPAERLEEYLELVDYVLFLGVTPGWPGGEIHNAVYRKIGAWRAQHPDVTIAADGHVTKETVEIYVRAGANILCANTAIFGAGNPVENMQQLTLLAQGALTD